MNEKGGEFLEREVFLWGQSGSGRLAGRARVSVHLFFRTAFDGEREREECVYIAMTRSVYDFVGSCVCVQCVCMKERDAHKKSTRRARARRRAESGGLTWRSTRHYNGALGGRHGRRTARPRLATRDHVSPWSTESITLRAVFVFVVVLRIAPGADAACRFAPSEGVLAGRVYCSAAARRYCCCAPSPPRARADLGSLARTFGRCLAAPPVAAAPLLPKRWRASRRALVLGAPPTWLVLALVRPRGADAALMLVALFVHGAFLVWALTLVKGSFTLGEAATLAQGAALLASDALLMTACASPPTAIARLPFLNCQTTIRVVVTTRAHTASSALATEALLAGGLCLTAILGLLLSTLLNAQRVAPYAFAAAIAVALGGVLLPWLGMLVDTGSNLSPGCCTRCSARATSGTFSATGSF